MTYLKLRILTPEFKERMEHYLAREAKVKSKLNGLHYDVAIASIREDLVWLWTNKNKLKPADHDSFKSNYEPCGMWEPEYFEWTVPNKGSDSQLGARVKLLDITFNPFDVNEVIGVCICNTVRAYKLCCVNSN